MSKKKIKRFHKDVFFPDWSEDSMQVYLKDILSKTPVTYSVHALDKAVDCSLEYGKKNLMETLKNIPLSLDNIFEFYSSGEKIRKACFRFSSESLPVDLVLVISADGVVITMYDINRGDNHSTLNENLYERN